MQERNDSEQVARDASRKSRAAQPEVSRTLADNPAPLSEALHIPTLIGENSNAERTTNGQSRQPTPTSAAQSGVLREDPHRATTPAGPPREDAASWFGVPSNHPQTAVSAKLAKLDRTAAIVGALMVIGPLFAAMVGRSMG